MENFILKYLTEIVQLIAILGIASFALLEKKRIRKLESFSSIYNKRLNMLLIGCVIVFFLIVLTMVI